MKFSRSISTSFTLGLILFFTLSTTFTTDRGKYFEISKNIEIFSNLYKELNTYYVDELDPSKLMRTGIEAMLESLDPYTNYISESDIEGYRFISEGKYTGIGAQFELMEQYPTITEIYEETPAQKAGLKAGDQILAIDGRSAKSRSAEDVNDIMKGYPGTKVEITVRRPGRSEELDITLTREQMEVPNVPYFDLIGEGIAYVPLTTFTREAGQNVANAIKEMKKENPQLKGVVLDLRDNGGGLLSEAVNLCNIFLPKGKLVVTTRGKIEEWNRSFMTMGPSLDEEIPVVVLINSRSASASEIVSGTLQDYDRGVLIGQRSYGKGLVQNTRDIGYNSKVKITISKYYIPSGRCIQSVSYENGEPVHVPDEERAVFTTKNGREVLDGGGVKPDILIDLDEQSDILTTLKEKHLIFDYATQFCLNHDSIPPVEQFRFTDWDDFVQYLRSRNFDYDTKSEKLLEQLKEQTRDNDYILEQDITQLEERIIEAKKDDLSRNKEPIIDLIEKEIASRYYYQDGRIRIGLRNDKEISEAIALLNDPDRYRAILAGDK